MINLVFSIDSILAAAMSPKRWVVITGIPGNAAMRMVGYR
jgi:predicted tellurium resistance membrane protein TerC